MNNDFEDDYTLVGQHIEAYLHGKIPISGTVTHTHINYSGTIWHTVKCDDGNLVIVEDRYINNISKS